MRVKALINILSNFRPRSACAFQCSSATSILACNQFFKNHGQLIRFVSDSSTNASLSTSFSPGGQDYKKRSWRDISTEWKVVASLVVAVTSFFLNARNDRLQLQKEIKLNRVQSQIKDLYGPLYGNRLVSETSYRAVMRNHRGLKKYLHEARINKNAEMIHRWRSYVWNVLYPLDKAAVEMILNNAHLVTHGEFPEEFDQLLIHAAKMEFIMQLWKSDDGSLESTKEFEDEDYLEANNASGMGFRTRILEHVKQKYDELREEQKQISMDISSEKQTDEVLGAVFKKAIHQKM